MTIYGRNFNGTIEISKLAVDTQNEDYFQKVVKLNVKSNINQIQVPKNNALCVVVKLIIIIMKKTLNRLVMY